MCDANEPGRAAGDRLAELLAAERVEPILVEPPADLVDPDGAPVVDLNAWAQLDPDWSTDLNNALGATARSSRTSTTPPPISSTGPRPELTIDD